MSEAKSIFIYLYASSPDAAAWMLKFAFVYLTNTAVLWLFIDNDLLLPGARLHILNNIYRK
jgi:hypothetical protein